MIKNIALASLIGTALLSTTGLDASAASGRQSANVVFVAKLHAMNTGIAGKTVGEARFTVRGDKLSIKIRVTGAPPTIEHWQHFHGFKDHRVAECPTESADVNRDGIVDLIETEPASGTTMVPFDGAPAAMDVPAETYPHASAKGSYRYEKTVSLKALEAAFAKAFDGQKLDLDRRVVYVHGVPDSTKLPSTVQSLGPIPARVTVPISCGKIERVSN